MTIATEFTRNMAPVSFFSISLYTIENQPTAVVLGLVTALYEIIFYYAAFLSGQSRRSKQRGKLIALFSP